MKADRQTDRHIDRLDRARKHIALAHRRGAVTGFRYAFFAQAGESASRYRISFDRLLLHLWDGRKTNPRLLLRSVVYVDDLVHAVACVDGVGLAWADLAERYERALIRKCRGQQDDIAGTVSVRRLFADLRRRSLEPASECSGSMPSFRSYVGTRPLRSWLADRMSAIRARGGFYADTRPKARQWTTTALRNGTFDQVWTEPAPMAGSPLRFSLAAAPSVEYQPMGIGIHHLAD